MNIFLVLQLKWLKCQSCLLEKNTCYWSVKWVLLKYICLCKRWTLLLNLYSRKNRITFHRVCNWHKVCSIAGIISEGSCDWVVLVSKAPGPEYFGYSHALETVLETFLMKGHTLMKGHNLNHSLQYLTILNLWWVATCLKRPFFHWIRCGLSRQVSLYFVLKSEVGTGFAHPALIRTFLCSTAYI